jgi:hypothetical protein
VDYVPYAELTGRPNVIADGSARRSTVLTLSHWPMSGTPWPLKADLSAEIARRYLASPEHHVDVDAVSNDHLDVDGFVSVLLLARPDVAAEHGDTLVETARAGDFATTANDDGRRLAAAIGAATHAATSPFDRDLFELQRPLQVAALFRELLAAVPQWLADLSSVAPLWRVEDDAFQAAEDAFAGGLVTIEEHADIDVAVVRLDPSLRLAGDVRSALQGWGPIHPVAVHNRTDRLRIVYVSGERVGLLYRFESWVQLVSRTAMPRVDLTALAAELTAAEPGGGSWSWAHPRMPNPPVPWLQPTNSELAANVVLERILAFLRANPASDAAIYDPRPTPYGAEADLVG